MFESNNKITKNHIRHQPENVNKKHQDSMGVFDKAGYIITRGVGTMITAIIFALLALISLPAAIQTHNAIIIVAWIAQTFLQLVLLPIIMVGQNIQSRHTEILADEEYKTTQSTYHDLENLIAINKEQLGILKKLYK